MKPVTEKDIQDYIEAGKLTLQPLEFRVVNVNNAQPNRDLWPDLMVETRWGKENFRFDVEVKRLATPKSLKQAIYSVQQVARTNGNYPMVVVPYLSPEKLKELEILCVSGIDLCGNGIIIIANKILVVRSGQPNRFPRSERIRNVYRGKNSLVARALLVKPVFDKVKDISMLTGVTMSTVSKALTQLEEDLVISRKNNRIKLLQGDILLDKLAANYEKPDMKVRYQAKSGMPADSLARLLKQAASQERLVISGVSSAEEYATFAQEKVLTVYTNVAPEILIAKSNANITKTDMFANLEIFQTDDLRVFFDPREKDGIPFASPVQTYLELISGDKRQQDAAEQVRRGILADIEKLNNE